MTEQLIQWYSENKRQLPWRSTKNPYKIWVSEIILQQTQIKTGISYYERFIRYFPDIASLARTNDIEVLKIWEGLGYYNRALNMLSTAKIIMSKYNGKFPEEYNELIKLKGVGIYTAAAISSICFNNQIGVVDGNVYRVLSRIYDITDPINHSSAKKKFQEIANQLVPKNNPGIYNQAIMDFGSIHCKKHNPKCGGCPINKKCLAFEKNTIEMRPVKIIKQKIKTRYFNYLFIEQNGHFLIQKRIDADIWNGLYQLPLIETKKKIKQAKLIQDLFLRSFEINNIQNIYNTNHNLSHQILKISFWKLNVLKLMRKPYFKKINAKEIINYPFPVPIKQFFHIVHTKV